MKIDFICNEFNGGKMPIINELRAMTTTAAVIIFRIDNESIQCMMFVYTPRYCCLIILYDHWKSLQYLHFKLKGFLFTVLFSLSLIETVEAVSCSQCEV